MTPIWSCYFETNDGGGIKNVEAETVKEAYTRFIEWAKVRPAEIIELDMVMIVGDDGTPTYRDTKEDE